MDRRLLHNNLLICLAASWMLVSTDSRATPRVPLVHYNFDDTLTETGPDTFQVFENAKGRVNLSSEFPFSGNYSVQIQDAAHNGDFSELQGYFPLRKSGHLLFHFAFMVANPEQALNIALAGPQHFSLRRDGIGFWLSLRKGQLFHTSNGTPKPLFQVVPFAWYQVDMNYDINLGRYDLRIADGSNSVVDIKNVANAVNLPGSVVDKFSFIGDLREDESSVNYFVDDVLINADTGRSPPPFVAPGRRQLFIDKWTAQQRLLQAKLRCLPVSEPEDFGLSQDWLRTNLSATARRAFWQVLTNLPASIPLPDSVAVWRKGIMVWRQGCQQLVENEADKALRSFADAQQLLPNAPLLEISRIQALAALKRWREVDTSLPAASLLWTRNDVRFDVAVGQIAWSRNDLQEQAAAWKSIAEAIPNKEFVTWAEGYFGESFNADKLERMLENKRQYPLLQHYIIAEQYFLSLIWQKQYNDAIQYADNMVRHFAALPRAQALWLERIGDASFLAGLYEAAAKSYQASVALNLSNSSALEKLADLAYRNGDTARERHYREAVYGTLHKAH